MIQRFFQIIIWPVVTEVIFNNIYPFKFDNRYYTAASREVSIPLHRQYTIEMVVCRIKYCIIEIIILIVRERFTI